MNGIIAMMARGAAVVAAVGATMAPAIPVGAVQKVDAPRDAVEHALAVSKRGQSLTDPACPPWLQWACGPRVAGDAARRTD